VNANAEPQLDAPGAGLPKSELLIARSLFAVRRLTGSRGSFNDRFQREREIIGRQVRSCGPEAAGTRVLIARLRGLEDSSRYWSVWMTLDHLRIVNLQIAKVIGALVHGVVPPGQASTANVKPSPEVTMAVVATYEESCDALLSAVKTAPHLDTEVRFAHPWFGPLDAAGWHALAAVHMGIHRGQIERILTRFAAAQNG